MTDRLPDRPPAILRVRDLPPARQAEPRRLHQPNPWWNLKILVFALIWIAAAMLVMCNLNYHIEHHLFPAVPWYHLPRLHALLRHELRRTGAQVYPSYTRFLWDLGRFVARAYAPGGESLPLRLPVPARPPLDEGLTGPVKT